MARRIYQYEIKGMMFLAVLAMVLIGWIVLNLRACALGVRDAAFGPPPPVPPPAPVFAPLIPPVYVGPPIPVPARYVPIPPANLYVPVPITNPRAARPPRRRDH